ncbi:response regulator transcription factor [Chryseomicrobium imtechense]
MLEKQPSCEWIVEATNFSMESELNVKEMIDIVIVDVTLGEKSGFEFIRQARKINTECKFIVFTASLKYQEFIRSAEIRSRWLHIKNVLPEEFLYALQIIKRGRKYYDPDVLELKKSWS